MAKIILIDDDGRRIEHEATPGQGHGDLLNDFIMDSFCACDGCGRVVLASRIVGNMLCETCTAAAKAEEAKAEADENQPRGFV